MAFRQIDFYRLGLATDAVKYFGIDFETSSYLNVADVGAYAYATHPSTSIICLSWADKQTGEKGVWWPGNIIPAPLLHALEENYTFVAHNAGFDRLIWRVLFTRFLKAIKREATPERWICTAVRASANGWPRALDECARAMGIGQKDEEGRKALEKMWKTDRHGKRLHDTPELRALTGRYCGHDTDLMFGVMARTKPLSQDEQAIWEVDQAINARGIPVDLDSCIRINDRLNDKQTGVYTWMHERVQRLTDHYVTKLTQAKRLKEWLHSLDLELPNLQSSTIHHLLTDWPAAPDHIDAHEWECARNALELKQTVGLAAPKKFQALALRAVPDELEPGWGTLFDAYVFQGAHTGRWTSQGFQTQNLMRKTANWHHTQLLMEARTFDDLDFILELGFEPLQLAGESVRPIVRARPGHKLLVGDFSKIETCVLFWIAGEIAGLDMLRAGHDIYCHFASSIYGRLITKMDEFERLMGKQGILGLGYGCGVHAFMDMLRKQHRILIQSTLAQRTVTAYRDEYKAVVRFWYNLERAIRKAISNDDAVEFAGLRIVANANVLVITLPSERKMRYRKPEVNSDGEISFMGVDPITKQWKRLRQWGGGFTENIVQAIANDLLREAMLRLDKGGYNLIMHSHDEIVAHERDGELLYDEFEAIMAVKPRWAKDIPISVEGFVTERYRK